MTIIKVIYLAINRAHPCIHLLNEEEERMVDTEDYLSSMEQDIREPNIQTEPILLEEWKEEISKVKKLIKDKNLENIILARSW